MAMLETPSRIWRRIEAVEGQDMPSLPSLPHFDDSQESVAKSDKSGFPSGRYQDEEHSLPMTSTPAALSYHTATSSLRPPSSTLSTARFATSIASRSVNARSFASRSSTRQTNDLNYESFDASEIHSLPNAQSDFQQEHDPSEDDIKSKDTVPEMYLPPDDDEIADALEDADHQSLIDGLQPMSGISTPYHQQMTPQKTYDYSVSLRSEPKPSPLGKYRHVSLRKPIGRTRTPSLTRTVSSSSSSSGHSTPHTMKSISLPAPSPVAIPVAGVPPRSQSGSPNVLSHDEIIQGEPTPIDDANLEGHEDAEEGYQQPWLEAELATIEEETPSQSQSRDFHESTFSSDAGTNAIGKPHSLAQSVPSSSPAPSTDFTPTPAARTRFTVAPANPQIPPSQVLADVQTPRHAADDEDASMTPHTRRRSFLLDVINSTTRPRMKFPTPYVRKSERAPPLSGKLPSTFPSDLSGLTPRPKPEMSPPLAQKYPPSEPSESGANEGAANASESTSFRAQLSHAKQPPYETERASFVSTASSHDLTTHHPINTSFDPVIGMGSLGVGRFNAGKLNSYLHGLNRRLQEENEVLLERLRKLEESGSTAGEAAHMRRISGLRRSSKVGTSSVLGDVKEENMEGWVEERAELEEKLDFLTNENERCRREKIEVESALDAERAARARDKERWKDRMGEVERGVEKIVGDLEIKVAEVEKRARDAEVEKGDAIRRAADAEKTRAMAMERAEKSEQVLESGRELGGELREANDRIQKLMGDLNNANRLVQDLEAEVMRSDGRVDELEKQLQESSGLEDEALLKVEELQKRLSAMEQTARKTDDEHRATADYLAELEQDAGAAVEQIESLEAQLSAAQQMIDQLENNAIQTDQRVEELNKAAQQAAERVKQLEEALDIAGNQIQENEEELAKLKARIASRYRDQEPPASSRGHSSLVDGTIDGELAAVEDELDKANQEIARLSTLLQQSPARKAIEKAKDARIEMLERDKEDLMETIRSLRSTCKEMASPIKIVNTSGSSPRHLRALASDPRTPKTPGKSLRELSFLSNSNTDPTSAPLIAEISRLQRELNRANESIDDKIDRLEEAGLGVVGLTSKLEDARVRITVLEKEISRLVQREDRRTRRLLRLRCQKCRIKIDMKGVTDEVNADESSMNISLSDASPTEPPTPPTKTSEALRANIQSLNAHLDALKAKSLEDKHRLELEKAALQGTADRLNLQVRVTKDEVARVAGIGMAEVEGDLEDARRTIAELEADLKEERSRLRVMTTEQNKIQREKESVLLQLRRMDADMDDVKQELQALKHDNHDLEAELRANATVDQKARLLEMKVATNAETIEQLRQERAILSEDHKQLRRRFTEISDHANRLREEHAASQALHNERRHQIDLHLQEIEDLRAALSHQADELQRTEEEKAQIASEKSDVAQDVAVLQADLKRVKRDAEAFGRDLKVLRTEKDRLEVEQRQSDLIAERARKQAQAQIRLLNERLVEERDKARVAEEQLQRHVSTLDHRELTSIKLRHNQECKGLIVQIRYLKAKFTRESSRRCMVVAQKDYMIALLAGFERSEQNILAAISHIGFPAPPLKPSKKTHSIKTAAYCVLFTLFARRLGESWRAQSAAKEAVMAALHEVRRRRVTASR